MRRSDSEEGEDEKKFNSSDLISLIWEGAFSSGVNVVNKI